MWFVRTHTYIGTSCIVCVLFIQETEKVAGKIFSEALFVCVFKLTHWKNEQFPSFGNRGTETTWSWLRVTSRVSYSTTAQHFDTFDISTHTHTLRSTLMFVRIYIRLVHFVVVRIAEYTCLCSAASEFGKTFFHSLILSYLLSSFSMFFYFNFFCNFPFFSLTDDKSNIYFEWKFMIKYVMHHHLMYLRKNPITLIDDWIVFV